MPSVHDCCRSNRQRTVAQAAPHRCWAPKSGDAREEEGWHYEEHHADRELSLTETQHGRDADTEKRRRRGGATLLLLLSEKEFRYKQNNSLSQKRFVDPGCVVGALRPHVYLRHSATTCGLELAHAPQLACTLIHWIVIACECEKG